jgi:ribosome-binding factor A
MAGHRTERVADQLRRELADILRHEVKDPRVRLATVSSVELSSDLQHARVLLSILGDDQERAQAFLALEHARGFVRRQLSSRLRLRSVPELRFEIDRGAEHSLRISQLLESLDDDPDRTP